MGGPLKKHLVNLAIGIAVVLAVFVVRAAWLASTDRPTLLTAEQVEARVLASDQGTIFRWMKTEMPEEYKASLAKITAVANRPDIDAFAEGAKITTDIGRKYAPRLAYAGLTDLDAIVAGQRAVFVMLQKAQPKSCADVLMAGPTARITALDKDQLAVVGNASLAVFKAMASGVKGRERHQALPEDYQAYYAAVVKAGVSEAEVDATADSARLAAMPAGRVCEIGVQMMDAVATLAPQMRLRFLSSMFSDAAAS